MVAVTSRYIYWASDNNTIGRVNLNGTGVNQPFITGASGPVGVAVNSKYVYWANNATGTIGRANLNGTGVNQRFLITHSHLGGVAIASGR
jgi:virginiamycin B lyase